MILADKIILLRRRKGWSQEELAERLGVTRQSISKWEGAQSAPELDKILRMSEVFGVSCDFLLKDEIEPDEPPIVEKKTAVTEDTSLFKEEPKVIPEMPTVCTAQSEPSESDAKSLPVSAADAREFIALRQKHTLKAALFWPVILLSFIFMIISTEMGAQTENVFLGVFTVIVGAALTMGGNLVAMLILDATRSSERKFAYLYTDAAAISVEAQQVGEDYESAHKEACNTQKICGGVMLPVGALILLLGYILSLGTVSAVLEVLGILVAAVGAMLLSIRSRCLGTVNLLIHRESVGLSRSKAGSENKEEEDEKESFTLFERIAYPILFVTVFLYIMLGIFLNAWGWAWIFPVAWFIVILIVNTVGDRSGEHSLGDKIGIAGFYSALFVFLVIGLRTGGWAWAWAVPVGAFLLFGLVGALLNRRKNSEEAAENTAEEDTQAE